jgi:hypothetical protein
MGGGCLDTRRRGDAAPGPTMPGIAIGPALDPRTDPARIWPDPARPGPEEGATPALDPRGGRRPADPPRHRRLRPRTGRREPRPKPRYKAAPARTADRLDPPTADAPGPASPSARPSTRASRPREPGGVLPRPGPRHRQPARTPTARPGNPPQPQATGPSGTAGQDPAHGKAPDRPASPPIRPGSGQTRLAPASDAPRRRRLDRRNRSWRNALEAPNALEPRRTRTDKGERVSSRR